MKHNLYRTYCIAVLHTMMFRSSYVFSNVITENHIQIKHHETHVLWTSFVFTVLDNSVKTSNVFKYAFNVWILCSLRYAVLTLLLPTRVNIHFLHLNINPFFTKGALIFEKNLIANQFVEDYLFIQQGKYAFLFFMR